MRWLVVQIKRGQARPSTNAPPNPLSFPAASCDLLLVILVHVIFVIRHGVQQRGKNTQYNRPSFPILSPTPTRSLLYARRPLRVIVRSPRFDPTLITFHIPLIRMLTRPRTTLSHALRRVLLPYT